MGLSTKDPIELPGEKVDPADRLAKQVIQHPPADAVCIEVPVRISGARVVAVVRDITEHTEPFRETTSTLIVFARGAVVRLYARVRAGQVLTLTNLRTKREASCRIVSVRTSAEGKSYVELEFAEQATGFWGISFPSELGTGSVKSPVLSAFADTAEASSSDALPGTSLPMTAPSRPNEPMVPSVIAEASGKKQKGQPINASLSAQTTVPGGSDLSIATPPSSEVVRAGSLPLGPSDQRTQPVVPTPLADEVGERTSAPWTSSSRTIAPTSVEERPVAASPSRDFLGSFKKSGRRATSPRKQPSLSEMLGITPDQEVITRRAASFRQPRRKLILTFALASFLMVALVGMWVFLRRQPMSMPGALASSTPVTAEQSASPNQSGTAPELSIQPKASPEAQLNVVRDKAPTAPIADSPGASAEPTANAPFVPVVTSDMTIENLSSRPTRTERPAVPTEQPPPPAIEGGVPGGVPNDQTGVMGAILSDASRAGPASPLPPMATAKPARPVGGRLQAPRLLSSVLPVYPTLATRSRVEGDVVIQTNLDASGKVVGMKVVSGPPLLQQAAMDALRRWKYEPAKLNDQPVSVQISVVIKFRLK